MEVGRRSGAAMHIAHYRTNADTAGETDRLMAPIDRARADGVDVTFDIYPYPTGSSFPVYLPGWAQEGGPDAILERLRGSGHAGPDRRVPRDRTRGERRPGAVGDRLLVRARRIPTLEGVGAPGDRRPRAAYRSARPSARCSSSTTSASATARPSRRPRAAGARSAAMRSRSCRGRTRWPAPTSRRSARCAIRGRSAPIRGSSAASAARSAASRSRRWSTG